jgi:hypothetical protein
LGAPVRLTPEFGGANEVWPDDRWREVDRDRADFGFANQLLDGGAFERSCFEESFPLRFDIVQAHLQQLLSKPRLVLCDLGLKAKHCRMIGG